MKTLAVICSTLTRIYMLSDSMLSLRQSYYHNSVLINNIHDNKWHKLQVNQDNWITVSFYVHIIRSNEKFPITGWFKLIINHRSLTDWVCQEEFPWIENMRNYQTWIYFNYLFKFYWDIRNVCRNNTPCFQEKSVQ